MQWVRHLEAKIEEQQRYARPFEQRYRNEYVLPFIAAEYREVYGDGVDALLSGPNPPRTGAAGVVVDSLTERLTVAGPAAPDPADKDALAVVRAAWEGNDLDVMHREAHREAFIKRRAFARVSRARDGRAVVGIESPEQMAIHREQAPPYDIDAGLKIWTDEWTGERRAELELPGRLVVLRENEFSMPDPEKPDDPRMTRWVVLDDIATRIPTTMVVEFANRGRLLVEPVSEIEGIVSLVDLDDLVEGLMVFAGHFGAVPIRYASGLPVQMDPKDPTKPLLGPDGKPVVGFKPRADHFWASTDKETRFGQLTPATLTSFIEWAEHISARLQAKTSIPSSYFGVRPKTHMSAELMKVDEAPMVRRVNAVGRDGSFGQAWRRLNALILQVERPGVRARILPLWVDPETRVEAQATDSFQKLVASGVGVRAAAEKVLGWDPEFVARAVAEGQAEQERAAALAEQLGAGSGLGGAPASGLEPVV